MSGRRVNLDRWLAPAEGRKSLPSVRERYRYDDIARDIEMLVKANRPRARREGPAIVEPGKTKASEPGGSEVLIAEGVVGLDVEFLRRIADRRIYVEIDEKIRRQRFWRYYRHRGLGDSEIQGLYAQRQDDETCIVETTRCHADEVITNGRLN